MDERIWKRIQLNGMAKEFSWKGPAAEYAKLYEAARAARGAAEAPQSSGKAAQGSGQASRAAGQAARNQSLLEHLIKLIQERKAAAPGQAAEKKEYG